MFAAGGQSETRETDWRTEGLKDWRTKARGRINTITDNPAAALLEPLNKCWLYSDTHVKVQLYDICSCRRDAKSSSAGTRTIMCWFSCSSHWSDTGRNIQIPPRPPRALPFHGVFIKLLSAVSDACSALCLCCCNVSLVHIMGGQSWPTLYHQVTSDGHNSLLWTTEVIEGWKHRRYKPKWLWWVKWKPTEALLKPSSFSHRDFICTEDRRMDRGSKKLITVICLPSSKNISADTLRLIQHDTSCLDSILLCLSVWYLTGSHADTEPCWRTRACAG